MLIYFGIIERNSISLDSNDFIAFSPEKIIRGELDLELKKG